MEKQRHKRIEHWDDERSIGNSLIVTLRDGWAFDPRLGVHVMRFDTTKEAMNAVRASRPCVCEQCQRGQQ